MDSTILEILRRASSEDIKLELENGSLNLKSKTGYISPEMIQEIRDKKELIIQHLQKLKDKNVPSIFKSRIQPYDRSGMDRIPLSYSQERLWFIDQLQGSLEYHIPFVLRLEGTLDRTLLADSLREIVSRHEVLRTVIVSEDGVGHQEVLPSEDWALEYYDAVERSDVEGYLSLFLSRAFDLSKDYMLRVGLYRLGEAEHILAGAFHHIASDGWSNGILINEFVALYSSKKSGLPHGLPALEIQYSDYALWQREHISGPLLEEQLSYWEGHLKDVSVLTLPTDRPRSPQVDSSGGSLSFELPPDLSASIRGRCQEEGVTLFMFLLAAFKVLLYRYSGQTDICVGTSVANRTQQELEGLIGFFVNTLALRSDVSGKSSFRSFLSQLRQTTLSAYDHQHAPFEKVVDRTVKTRDMATSPLFQVMFVLQNTPEEREIVIEGLSISTYHQDITSAKRFLTLTATELDTGIAMNIEYRSSLFDRSTMERMASHYRGLLEGIVLDLDRSVGSIPMLTPQELTTVLEDFQGPEVVYDSEKTLVDLFEQQARSTPEHVALVYQDRTLTYRELDRRSNQLARYLKGQGSGPEALVGICIERSLEMVIGILGILKSGGAYVPMDPDYPSQRIGYMLEDSQIRLLLSSSGSIENVPDMGHSTVLLDRDWALISEESTRKLSRKSSSDNLAYVIYTSGSTGQPKGVMVEHASISNEIQYYSELFEFGTEDRQLLLANYAFDASVEQIFLPITNGGALVLISNEDMLSPEKFEDSLDHFGITHFQATPSLLKTITPRKYSKLQRVCSGGEVCPPDLAVRWSAHVKFFNKYGPTEAAVNSTYYSYSKKNPGIPSIPIGKPLANVQLYVLDSNECLVPIGVPGELHIGGVGVARGYLNRKELNHQKFITHPQSKNNQRLYKTGDLVKWLPDGNLLYLGRTDTQVKIRGYRIEVEEIEIAIQNLGLVSAVSVITRSDENSHERLIAYVIDKEGFSREEAQKKLSASLPEYMVPAIWIKLKEFPLTPNGKVDRNSLPHPERLDLTTSEYVAPETTAEKNLAEIWKALLSLDSVSVHDNFFELGGDSIIAIQVVSRAKRMGFNLQPRDLFEHQTIASLALIAKKESKLSSEQGRLSGPSGLLPAQQRYFETQHRTDVSYNQAVLLELSKDIGEETLQLVFKTLINYHDALRFSYAQDIEKNKWIQTYQENVSDFSTSDLSSYKGKQLQEQIAVVCLEAQHSISLKNGNLSHFRWIKTSGNEPHNFLYIVVHHLAVDGVSWRVLLNDLSEMLSKPKIGKFDLGYKGTSVRQWVNRLAEFSETPKVIDQLTFWESVQDSYNPLPTDYSLEEISTVADLKNYHTTLDPTLSKALLLEVNKAYTSEVTDLLYGALAKTLCDWTGHNEIVIGVEGHGREDIAEDIDISSTVGWFTNLFPALFQHEPHYKEGHIIKSAKEQLSIFRDKGLGYSVLRYLHPSAELRAKLNRKDFDVVLNYLGQLDNIIGENSIVRLADDPIASESNSALPINYKISVVGAIVNESLKLSWSYSRHEYEEKTIETIADAYISNLTALITYCGAKTTVEKTPSDSALAPEISFQEFDEFLDVKENGQARRTLINSVYPLSPLQQGILFHELYNEDFQTYLGQFSCDFPEGIDVNRLQQAWKQLLAEHSILRSGFSHDIFKIPVQFPYKEADLPYTYLDYSSLDGKKREGKYLKFLKQDRLKGIALDNPPLMRIAVFKMGGNKFRMLWTHHHLILDGWSVSNLMAKFLRIYEELLENRKPKVSEEDHYEDYIRFLSKTDKYQEEAFWKTYMNGVTEPILLPFIKDNIDRNKTRGIPAETTLTFDETLSDSLKTLARNHHLTMNTILQGVWAVLLSKYSGKKEVTYGVVVSGRPPSLDGIEDKVGLFINSIPLYAKLENNTEVLHVFENIQKGQIKARDFEYSSLASIQNWTGVKGDLFDSILVFENYPIVETLTASELPIKIENVQTFEETNYPLTIVTAIDDVLSIKFLYNEYLLSDESVSMIKGHFRNVLFQILNKPEIRTNDIRLLTSVEENIFKNFNNTVTPYPKEKNLIDLFEEQVQNSPQAIAVEFDENQMSYQELNRRANQLAHYLIKKGVSSNDLVGVCVERSFELIIGILGILKSGAAYVPIDPEYPQDRISYIVKDTSAKVILCDGKSRRLLMDSSTGADLLNLENQYVEIEKESGTNPSLPIQNTNLIYSIYTSGSTGIPKGSLVQHKGLTNLVNWYVQEFEFSENSHFLLSSSINFDLTQKNVFAPIISGGRLCISSFAYNDFDQLIDVVEKFEITNINCTPSVFYGFVDHREEEEMKKLSSLEYVVLGGEPISFSNLQEWYTNPFNKAKVVNSYGPTECSDVVSYFIIDYDADKEMRSIPIGKPIYNTELYILDSDHMQLPMGVQGELFIGGECVGSGYLNRPDLTASKFVPNPFSGVEGDLMYRTGDLARWLPDGNIEFIGRADHQVKIRGYRIELGEIESVLSQEDQISSSCVLVHTDENGSKRLVGYVVADGDLDRTELQKSLKQQLPDYMVPTIWVELDGMPLTANGKIDRASLPLPDQSSLSTRAYVGPRTETEESLAAIWQELLGVDRIGVLDNFFELGGHSLLATRLVSMVRRQMDVDLAIRDVFVHPTISELGGHISGHSTGVLLPSIVPYDRSGMDRVPLSYSQERLWFIDQLQGSLEYHIPFVLRLEGTLDRTLLADSLREIVSRHEVLRTVILSDEGVGHQEVLPSEDWALEYYDAVERSDVEGYLSLFLSRAFDLSKDYMLRVGLYRLGEAEHILAGAFHHIASDGWSNAILINEFVALYGSKKSGLPHGLPALGIQYSDYALWQREHISGSFLEEQLSYWEGHLKDVSALILPTDRPRSPQVDSSGGSLSFELPPDLSASIHGRCQEEGVTLFMFLLAAFKVLLYRYSGQNDICVGTSVANRTQQELEGLIGFFVNTLALRSDVSGNTAFRSFLSQVKRTTLDAYEHQHAPFEKIVDRTVKTRDMATSPLFQVMFVLQNTPEEREIVMEGLSINLMENHDGIAKIDIAFNVNETAENLQLVIEYRSSLFDRSTMERMASHYRELLEGIVLDLDRSVGSIPMLTSQELATVLEAFQGPEVAYDTEKTLVDLFEQQARSTPENVALVYQDRTLTYRELDRRSNQLARHLKQLGAGQEALVGICIERSLEMVIGILGILKSGGAYVPIDPDYPSQRIGYMLEDAQIKLLLSSSGSIDNVPDLDHRTVLLDRDWETISQRSARKLSSGPSQENLAYVIYTSGSTGQPKGVMIEHSNLTALLYSRSYYYGEMGSMLSIPPMVFDPSVVAIFGTLVSGASLIIPKDEAINDVAEMRNLLDKKEIDFLLCSPTYYDFLLSEKLLDSFTYKRVLFGGEPLNQNLISRHYNAFPERILFNEYGPTECTVWTSVSKVYDNQPVTIGKPISNTRLYIVSEDTALCPIGIVGELCISGSGLSRGYLNRPDLTASKFVPNPFSGIEGDLMYRTGDLARWLPDGNIEFIGRADHQVKIRGYRIELGEIESVLSQEDQISSSCVLVHTDENGSKRLVGYVVADGDLDRTELQKSLKQQLPDYMVPTIWVELDGMPLTANGKIDRASLPLPDQSSLSTRAYVGPRTETESPWPLFGRSCWA
ncbi:amino acid adenylation domain-containing protein [Muricauda sp. SCSIO 64092]|uniref:non-ribosomal peptide synthetase n=1 Tax=Allomuricauda sp. SCSIO 64092 TaxID=2908842 RepID=UPI001FF6EC52|nr:non-ribosomal peptide synthetase [Muricauda sp. SCSIO 64092]UOY05743.1 amino acid adenylation domain-containing protein [Muricauda sp. SCSIO 64092]